MVAGQNHTRLSNVHFEPDVLVATLQPGADQPQPQLQGAVSLAHSKIPHKAAEVIVQESSQKRYKEALGHYGFLALHCIEFNFPLQSPIKIPTSHMDAMSYIDEVGNPLPRPS